MLHGSRSMTLHSTTTFNIVLRTVSTLWTVFGARLDSRSFKRCAGVLVRDRIECRPTQAGHLLLRTRFRLHQFRGPDPLTIVSPSLAADFDETDALRRCRCSVPFGRVTRMS